MYTTLLGAVSKISQDVKNVKKSINKWKKSHAKTAFIASLCLKVVLVSVPIGALPAKADEKINVNLSPIAIEINRDASMFADQLNDIKITAGESNTTVLTRRKALQKSTPIQLTPAPSLEAKRDLYRLAGEKYGVPAELIEAVHQIESGKSWDTGRRSYAGATGPMQFMQSTFRSYCVRTGEGCSITSAKDSIFAASLLLSANYNGSWDNSIMRYNHSIAYVKSVKNIANELGANI